LLAGLALLFTAGRSQADPYDFDRLPRGGGGIVVDQPPTRLGGHGSDTLYRDRYGNEVWSRIADNVLLAESAAIRRVTWWGFYGAYEQNHEPPTGPETMRVRFYGARPGDGLPGDMLYEESFLNPSRTATGEIIQVGGLPDEYLYHVDLATSVELAAQTLYWLEIVQVGDLESHFRWETGFGAQDGVAYLTSSLPDWQFDYSGSMGFQLSTVPEPSTLVPLLLGLTALRPRRGRKERCRG
jgi:hypothetical protein